MNFCRVIRLQIRSDQDHSLFSEQREQTRRLVKTESQTIPEHLASLYENSSKGFMPDGKQNLLNLLIVSRRMNGI